MSTTLDYDTTAALQAARRGLSTDAGPHYGRATHASTDEAHFAAGVAALADYLNYEVARRKRARRFGGTGAPNWSEERWEQHRLQINRLSRILAHYLVKLADDVESGTLTVAVISRFMNTGQLRTPRQTRTASSSSSKQSAAAA